MAASEAAPGGAARRLPLLVLPADAGAACRGQPALTALVSLVQRGAGPVPPGDRHPGGRETLRPRVTWVAGARFGPRVTGVFPRIVRHLPNYPKKVC